VTAISAAAAHVSGRFDRGVRVDSEQITLALGVVFDGRQVGRVEIRSDLKELSIGATVSGHHHSRLAGVTQRRATLVVGVTARDFGPDRPFGGDCQDRVDWSGLLGSSDRQGTGL
jgi:hypothetical protein